MIDERRELLRTLVELETENSRLVSLDDELDDARARLAAAQQELEVLRRLRRVHEDTLSSLSWRLTRPLRWGLAHLRSRLRAPGPRA